MNFRMIATFVSIMEPITTFPTESITGTEMVARWTYMPEYFLLSIQVLLSSAASDAPKPISESDTLLRRVEASIFDPLKTSCLTDGGRQCSNAGIAPEEPAIQPVPLLP